MGSFHTDPTTAWTFVLLLFTVAKCSDQFEFLQSFSTSDISKTNISQAEYTDKMSMYLRKLEESHGPDGIPKLLTYYSDNRILLRRKESIRLRFHNIKRSPNEEIESSELKVLFPRQTVCNTSNIRVFEMLSPRRRRLLSEKKVYLSKEDPKWADFDVTEVSQRWISGERNLGLELQSTDCHGESLKPLEAAINMLYSSEMQKSRRRRSISADTMLTDCSNVNFRDKKKPKCCRHDMHVSFEKLNIGPVIAPKSYEAGFCKGRCPLNFNHATNHSRIQNLVHKLDRRSTPRACCAPSRLEPLEILMVDPHDPSKLSVERWDNMIVIECACS